MTWSQIIVAIVVGVTGVGFAQVIRAVSGRGLDKAKADLQIIKNAQEIIDELKERNTEILTQWRQEVSELRNEVGELKLELRRERNAAREETARLYTEIAIKDREIISLRQQNGTSDVY